MFLVLLVGDVESTLVVGNYCGQFSHHPIVDVVYLQEKFSQIKDASDKNFPTIKSKRRLSNNEKSEAQRERELISASRNFILGTFQDCCLIPFYNRTRYGPAINDADNWRIVKSSGTVKSAWVVRSLIHVLSRTAPHGGRTACPWQENSP